MPVPKVEKSTVVDHVQVKMHRIYIAKDIQSLTCEGRLRLKAKIGFFRLTLTMPMFK